MSTHDEFAFVTMCPFALNSLRKMQLRYNPGNAAARQTDLALLPPAVLRTPTLKLQDFCARLNYDKFRVNESTTLQGMTFQRSTSKTARDEVMAAIDDDNLALKSYQLAVAFPTITSSGQGLITVVCKVPLIPSLGVSAVLFEFWVQQTHCSCLQAGWSAVQRSSRSISQTQLSSFSCVTQAR